MKLGELISKVEAQTGLPVSDPKVLDLEVVLAVADKEYRIDEVEVDDGNIGLFA